MGYEKQTWVNGEVITDNKLNHMEDGIANAGGGDLFVVTVTPDSDWEVFTTDKTYSEVESAVESGKVVVFRLIDGDYINYLYQCDFDGYSVGANYSVYTSNIISVMTLIYANDGSIRVNQFQYNISN